MKVAITGHRPGRLGIGYVLSHPKIDWLKTRMREALLTLNCTKALSGFALGCDQWFAEVALDLKIPLVAVIPFVSQESKWPIVAQKHYHDLRLKAAEQVIVAPGGYASWKLIARNEWLVDHCDHLIAVFDGQANGGTSQCLDFAVKSNRSITMINPMDFVGP